MNVLSKLVSCFFITLFLKETYVSEPLTCIFLQLILASGLLDAVQYTRDPCSKRSTPEQLESSGTGVMVKLRTGAIKQVLV